MSAPSHVPPSSGVPHTCSRGAGMGDASVGVQGEGSAFTRYRERERERRARYRGVSRAGAMGRRRDGERWRGRSRGQPCEARCRTRRRSRLHGSRQSCRHDGGRAVRMPVRGEAGTGDASGATATSRCDARGRRSRPGRARRRPRRARREAPARASTNTRRAVREYRRGVARAAAPDRDGKDERTAPTDRRGP